MRKIRVTVNPDGTTKTDMVGFVGESCLAEGEKLRQLLATYGIKSVQTGFEAKPELAQAQEEGRSISQEGKVRG